MSPTSNRLARESSPYLLKHAHDPVDWYPWGPEAFERARTLGRPILLSVGYFACHWCSVMHAESFSDAATAQVMNELFVNVKVDREERPDVDRIYQIAHQMLTQRGGGWPLTMFLTPDDRRPFFGGTYFPKDARFGLPSFRELLERVAQYYREKEPELRAQNAALVAAFDELVPPVLAVGEGLSRAPLDEARSQLEATFDARDGGFGGAPKFPHAALIERLLRDWHATSGTTQPDLHSLLMATLTLRRMGDGGVFDQLGGGFFRYSTDAEWMIPHFEKMLYDNATLLAAYSFASLATGDEFYAGIARETADFLQRELASQDGAFVSSFDADSEGHEGRFYVWDRETVRAALTPDEYAAAARRFGLDRDPNFEGLWHLHGFGSIDAADDVVRLESARRKLLALRARRVPPGRDEKILTGWNALAIRGFAIAARSLVAAPPERRAALEVAATRALDFVRRHLWRKGRLLAAHRVGQPDLPAYLDDYAFLADAVLELLQLRFRADELAFLRELLDALLANFEDADRGGFWFTAHDHETLFHRSKSFADDATPSGNGVAAYVLQRAGFVLGDTRYLTAAERTLRAGWHSVVRYPHGHAAMLAALDEHLEPPTVVILRGTAATVERWRAEIAKLYSPSRIALAIPTDTTDLPPSLADKPPRGEAVAYLCRGTTCSAPIESLAELIRGLRLALSELSSSARG